MIAKLSQKFFSPLESTSAFMIFLFAMASLFFMIATLTDSSMFFVPAGIFLTVSIFLISRPIGLLSLLIITRMSLDYFSNSYSIPIGEYFTLSFSQAIGIEVAIFGSIALVFLRKKIGKLPFLFPLASIILWGFFSMLLSIDPGKTAQELLRVFDILVLFALSFFAVSSRKDLQTLFLAFFASSVLPLVFGIYQFIFTIGFHDENVNIPRIFGTFSHPNIFSLYLFSLIAVSLLFFTMFATTEKRKLLTATLITVYMSVLFITYTRIAWIILLTFLSIITLLRFRKFLLPVIFIPFLLFFALAPFQERIIDSFRASPDSSVSWRINIWEDAIGRTIANGKMFFGYGMNTFPIVSENIRGQLLGPSNDPHNDFVKFFVEGGIFGLGIFVFFIGATLLSLAKIFTKTNDPDTKTVFVIIFAFFASLSLASLSDNIFKNTPVQWIFWITLGATLKIFISSKISEKEKPANSVLQK